MRLQHFYSDWNGMQVRKPFHRKPLQRELNIAIANHGIAKIGDATVIVQEKTVVVGITISNDFVENRYRDMYRIL